MQIRTFCRKAKRVRVGRHLLVGGKTGAVRLPPFFGGMKYVGDLWLRKGNIKREEGYENEEAE